MRRGAREGRRVERLSISISREVVTEVNRLVDTGEWRNRSDAFEKSMRETLQRRRAAKDQTGVSQSTRI